MRYALDLFCKAGGASEGLKRAGFKVVGVDIEPQPNYPYEFYQKDALTISQEFLDEFDFIWASPPCQGFTAYRRTKKVGEYPNLIPAVRELLRNFEGGTVIENVEGAPLRDPLILCGSMFGLDVRRHRLFETNFRVTQLLCQHDIWTPRFPQATNRKNLRKTVEVGVYRIPLETQKKAMGIERKMTLAELSNAIPPSYSEYIAREWLTGQFPDEYPEGCDKKTCECHYDYG